MTPCKIKARLFVQTPLQENAGVPLSSHQAHYLKNVMRAEKGETVALFNGVDGEWSAHIETLGKNKGVLGVNENLRPQSAEPDLWLAFALLKKVPLAFLAEKATELGVSRLMPVLTQRTQSGRFNLQRFQANAIEAAEQSERLSVPQVDAPVSLEKLLDQWPQDRALLVGDETGGGAPLRDVLEEGPCGFLVGPEGGLAPEELDVLGKLPIVTLVGLGPRILRAETAALSVLACWQAFVGDGHHLRKR